MEQDRADTKGRILSAAYRLFYRQGYSRVSVDAIADAAGVTKRTVYYHFRSKDDVVTAVIEVQHHHLMNQYQAWLEPAPEMASDIVENLFSSLKFWADGPDWLGSGFTRISAELADMHGHPARLASGRHKKKVEGWLADRFSDVGVNGSDRIARAVMVLIEGSMSLALIHGDTAYIDAAAEAAKGLVKDR